MYRSADGQSVWLFHSKDGVVELRNRDSDGDTLATFADPAEAFDDPIAYPATEADIKDFDEWSVIKRPVILSVAFGEGGLDRSIVDMVEVPGSGEDELRIVENGGDCRTPIADLVGSIGA